jgi:hypothetical protein
MYQDATDTDLDLRKIMSKVMKSIALLNPHVSLSDIAYLMDMPYDPEPLELDTQNTAENF